MKMGIKLNTADKVGLAVAGIVIWTIGLPYTVVGGGLLYGFRKNIRGFFIRRKMREKANQVSDYFKTLFKR